MKEFKKTVWTVIQDNSLPENGSLNRHYNFAKYLLKRGYRPVVFVASKARCSNRQMIEGRDGYLVDFSQGFPFVYIRVNDYKESMKKRLVAMIQFHVRLHRLSSCFSRMFGRPDVVLGSSAYPLSPLLAHVLSKKFDCKYICEVRDLWPLSLEEYGIIAHGGLIAKSMYRFERYLYEKADACIFTMEGGRDYIKEKGWDTESGGKIDPKKVFHINNGIDFEEYEKNKELYRFRHRAFENKARAKVVYAGSIRKANGLAFLVDVAAEMREDPVDFVVVGDGNEREELELKAKSLRLENMFFVGQIEKQYIPSALSQGTIMLMVYLAVDSPITKYGGSQNKLFDYLGAGKPVLSNLPVNYSIVEEDDCGIERRFAGPDDCARTIRAMLSDKEQMGRWGINSLNAAQRFSYENLADRLMQVIEGITEETK